MHTLEGLRIVVTRAPHQAEELARPLRRLGAEVILLPAIDIVSPSDPDPLRRAAADASRYDWIIFTSANAVRAFADAMPEPPASCPARVGVVGSATCRVAEKQGFRVSALPDEYVAESLLEALPDEGLSGRRVLIPSAAVTRDVVATELRKRGAQVEVVEAYRNIMPPETRERAASVFREPYPDWVTFTSPSAVENLVCAIGVHTLERVKIAGIGPVTSETIRKFGLTVAAEGNPHTIQGLVSAILSRA